MNEEIPAEIMKNYQVKLLGKPFSEMQMNGKIKRGYEFDGNRYYENEEFHDYANESEIMELSDEL